MKSPFANIFFALCDIINSLLADDGNPVIKTIDIDNGQLEYERPPVSYPCVLLNFQNWNFSNESNLIQIAEGNIIVKCATTPYSSTSAITPIEFRKQALEVLDLEQQLYTLLHGTKINCILDDSGNPIRQTTALIRTRSITDNRRVGLKIQETTFSTSFTDVSAKPTQRTASATPNITH